MGGARVKLLPVNARLQHDRIAPHAFVLKGVWINLPAGDRLRGDLLLGRRLAPHVSHVAHNTGIIAAIQCGSGGSLPVSARYGN